MRLIFAGTPQIAGDALSQIAQHHEIALVITRPDAPSGRKQVMTPSAVADRATALGLQVLKTNKIHDAELTLINKANAEVAVVVAFGSLVPRPALELLPWWNLHFSMLPKWRGATPLQHSMMTGEGVGISLFELEVGLDTGPIIAQQPMSFLHGETAGEALSRFTQLGTQLIIDSLAEKPITVPQSGQPSTAPKIPRFQARLDFAQPADQLAAKINALNPEPMAWAELLGNPIRLLRADSLRDENNVEEASEHNPGEVWLGLQGVMVGCAEGGQLALLEVQPAGKKAMDARDWFRGLTGQVKFD